MSILEIIQLCVIGVMIILFAIWFIIKAIKNKWISEIIGCIDKSIKKAEELYGPGAGDEKKKFVMNQVEARCKELEIPYSLMAKVISKIIDITVKHYNVIAK